MSRELIDSIEGEYRRYKALAEAAMAQLGDEDLVAVDGESANSIATIVWHVAGNLASRFTDFMASDGEKPWRNRDEEFMARNVSRAQLLANWEQGWSALLGTLASLGDDDLARTVTIRSVPLRVHQALHRSLAHTSYHVGQIVHIAKLRRGVGWRSLSIPKGQSAEYNRAPPHESAEAHAEHLKRRERG